jgi:GH15 family glucan-1,4-alpha-glucosidase
VTGVALRSETPIGDYALLGDTRSAALVSSAGDIDWWCLPRFDSGPVCGRLLGGAEAGHLSLGPVDATTVVARDYLPGSPVLRTTWQVGAAEVTLTEGMVSSVRHRLLPATLLVRRIETSGAPARCRLAVAPRYGWSTRPLRRRTSGDTTAFIAGAFALAVTTSSPLELDGEVETEFDLRPGEPFTVAVTSAYQEPLVHLSTDQAWAELQEDMTRWREWTGRIPGDLPFRSAAERSAMVLRLLTHSPTGAPVAAPTTSLPEHVGGIRNWDYRYTWPRDASIGVAAFLGLGMEPEARMFLRWLLHASRLDRPRLPVLLTLDGQRVPKEHTVAGWPGYRGSRPVRTGNGAREQHQLDGYGWVVDAMSIYDRAGRPLNGEEWRAVMGFADFVATKWRLPDAGIWEERGDPTQHTHSKLMGWLALDGAIELATRHRVRASRLARWEAARDEIGDVVRRHGFSPLLNSYTRTLDGADVDAACLVLPLLRIEPPGSPRVTGTIDAVWRDLTAGGPYLYRYRPDSDGLPGKEGAFLPCSFWLVQALATTGRTEEATALMKRLLETSPLGLFSEEADTATGEPIGNYPQALTHAALLQAVLALRDAGVRCEDVGTA